MLNSLSINAKYFFIPSIKEIIAASVLPLFKEVGKLEMKEVFRGIKEHNDLEIYKNTLCNVYLSFSLLRKTAITTSTIIDDGIIELVLESIRECAEDDRINLV
jgi:hypothetical protein